ncbi:O-antigen ligase family protein [Priestia megaterium]|uniref:O-antigen ligase family protein n=1 Tax=Priestia megaterium TaxID=1404 RepID=UPI003AAE1D2F
MEVSLSNRIYIWDIAYSKILQHPLLGWGNNSKGWIIEYNWYNYYAHNLVLDILIQGGIITMLGMYFILNHSRMSLSRQGDKYLESLLSCCILSIFTMNITESQFTSAYFYIPFILAWLLSTYNPNSTRANHKKLLS